MTDRLDTTRRAFSIGIDAGSTTIKFVVLDKTDGSVAYSSYRRHFADIRKISFLQSLFLQCQNL